MYKHIKRGAVMGRKRILPEHIKSIQTSFDDLSSRLEDKSESLIESSATQNFSSATNEVKTLAKDLVPIIQSFDEYLNAVADEFSRVDNEMGHVIDGGVLQQFANNKSETEMLDKQHISQKNIDFYNSQFNDFPA